MTGTCINDLTLMLDVIHLVERGGHFQTWIWTHCRLAVITAPLSGICKLESNLHVILVCLFFLRVPLLFPMSTRCFLGQLTWKQGDSIESLINNTISSSVKKYPIQYYCRGLELLPQSDWWGLVYFLLKGENKIYRRPSMSAVLVNDAKLLIKWFGALCLRSGINISAQ